MGIADAIAAVLDALGAAPDAAAEALQKVIDLLGTFG